VYWCWFLCFVLNAGICLPQAAHAGLDAWSALSGAERAGWLRMLAAAVEAKREPLMQLEAINTGRTINEMGGDLDDTGVFLEYWAEMAGKLDDKQGEQLDAPSGYEITMRYDAAGVAACVLPFNWPLVNVVLKLGPALAAGCCVVLKPSEYTPLTTLAFAKVVQEINFPAGVINWGRQRRRPAATSTVVGSGRRREQEGAAVCGVTCLQGLGDGGLVVEAGRSLAAKVEDRQRSG
jgi:acyl-CoA reductase-like NAD-dependent aldehyde dehydrogenase